MIEVLLTYEQEDRFWSRVVKGAYCWEWTAGLYRNGYGQFSAGYRKLYAHRVAFCLSGGDIPEGMQVCHRCDNRKCVRPDHLFVGTARDNSADMYAKGREFMTPGLAHPNRTIDAVKRAQILEMKAAGAQQRAIARQLGVSESAVSLIVRGLQRKTS